MIREEEWYLLFLLWFATACIVTLLITPVMVIAMSFFAGGLVYSAICYGKKGGKR